MCCWRSLPSEWRSLGLLRVTCQMLSLLSPPLLHVPAVHGFCLNKIHSNSSLQFVCGCQSHLSASPQHSLKHTRALTRTTHSPHSPWIENTAAAVIITPGPFPPSPPQLPTQPPLPPTPIIDLGVSTNVSVCVCVFVCVFALRSLLFAKPLPICCMSQSVG